MEKEETCLCASGDVLLLTCSGGSNVGQIANQAAVELAKEGCGKLFCLAGIGTHLDTMIVATKDRKLVVIDGCPVQCGKKILEHAGLKADLPIVVTDLGIEKTHNLKVEPGDCGMVMEKAKEGMKRYMCPDSVM